MATVGEVLAEATSRLRDAGIDTGAREARLLLARALGIQPGRLTTEQGAVVEPGGMREFAGYLERRLAREPVSHILGVRAFYKHDFHVGPEVLDPRPETECLVSAALEQPFGRVLDLGTGSGAILLSLLDECRDARGVGTDLSAAALRIAARNADNIGVAARAQLLLSDWFDAVTGAFDLIVSNPPYITRAEMQDLPPELAYEPRMALTDEGDGLGAYRAIVPGAKQHLTAGGRLMVEIGWQQGKAVARLYREAGFLDVGILPDLDGRDRVVTGVWCG